MSGDDATASASRIVRDVLTESLDARQENAAAALLRVCVRVTDNVRDAMGEDGCSALLARALARSELTHPALTLILKVNGDAIHLDGIAASVDAYGFTAVVAAVEAVLTALVEILVRLIGEDMAIRLIDPGIPRRPRGAKEAP